MITEWRLANFKSVREPARLDLKPLTILAGPNSSGKSTVIQSLLLIAQTLGSQVASHQLVLNGHLVKLGQFDDLRSSGSSAHAITIGWTCCPKRDQAGGRHLGLTSAGSPLRGLRRVHLPDSLRDVSCDISFDAEQRGEDVEISQIYPTVTQCQVRTRVAEEGSFESDSQLTATRVASSSADVRRRAKQLGLAVAEVPRSEQALRYEVHLDEMALRELDELSDRLGYRVEPIGCTLHHVLPSRLALRADSEERLAANILRVIYARAGMSGSRAGRPLRELRLPDDTPPDLLAKLEPFLDEETLTAVEQVLVAETVPAPQSREAGDKTYSQAARNVARHRRLNSLRLAEKESELQAALHQTIEGSFKQEYVAESANLPSLAAAEDYLESFFSGAVKYLGPLRDEPRALYPPAPTADPLAIGLRGENTASVLELHKSMRVSYVPAARFRSMNPDCAPRRDRLDVAVKDWLEYLGVAVDIVTKDRGRLGHEIKVKTSASSEESHDLTHVGVGVSQVLPILVGSLLAETDATLVFEQPELHLHPMVQSRLADFFMSLAVVGKQCLIETHSEHLVNHLRLRAAAAEDDRVSSLVALYFVEKRDGSSVFTPVVVNEFGAILDWPEGFFDQAELAAEDILRAAMRKRQRQRDSQPDA